MAWKEVKRYLVGDPISSERAHHERLSKKTALAVFSSDALSSVAYSTEAILLVLLAAGSVAIGYLVPIVIGITVLLSILTLSYRQTIHAYPSGGGAYIVAKDNLGTQAGLVAGASLLVDYILTVAVSVSAGVAAITSAAKGTRLELLQGRRVALCVFMVAFIALINLRGVRESGAIFAGPTYLFILSMLALVAVGFFQYYATGQAMPTPSADEVYYDESVGAVAHGALTGFALVWLLMRAFAAGCTALTGVEAISNGIPAFKRPESKNAAATLTWMALVMTTLILFIFEGEEQAMLPLYAVGVFLSFTLSQSGMVIHWLRERRAGEAKERIRAEEAERLHLTEDPSAATHMRERLRAIERDEGRNWLLPIVINAAGAVITFVVLVVIALAKFTHGAWAVVVLIPVIVFMFRAINGHYRMIAAQLSLKGVRPNEVLLKPRIIIPVSGIHRGVLPALDYARSMSRDGHADATAVYVEINPENTEQLKREWKVWGKGIPLKVLPSPFRSVTQPLLKFIHEEANACGDSIVTVVLPEFVPRTWWQQLLHNQSALLIKGKLLFSPQIVVTSVPHHLRR